MSIRVLPLLLLCALTAPIAAAKAQNAPADGDKTETDTRVTEHQWLWGVGRANVLDTYLSPLEYTGTDVAATHRTERTARWGKGRVSVHGLYTGHAAYLHSPTDDGKEWDAELAAAGGWLYNWSPGGNWRFAAGGLAEAATGFTYNTRGSNNPAQGRLGASINAAGTAEYGFKIGSKPASVRLTADVQLIGMQFAPEYGQSYYEIFSLGHTDGIIHLTHPGNCPTTRLQAVTTLPLAGAYMTLGYQADIRQSRLGGLKRHAWRNSFMIGYTRRLRLLR